MLETPSAKPLQEARAKRSKIMAIVKPSIFVKTLKYFDVVNVITRLQQCDIVHFAYYEVSNLVDSSKSDLILKTTTKESR